MNERVWGKLFWIENPPDEKSACVERTSQWLWMEEWRSENRMNSSSYEIPSLSHSCPFLIHLLVLNGLGSSFFRSLIQLFLVCAWYCVPWVLKGKKLLTKQFLKVYETMKGNERWVNDAISSLNWCLRLKVTRSDTNPIRIPIQSKFRLGLVLLPFCSTFEPVETSIFSRHEPTVRPNVTKRQAAKLGHHWMKKPLPRTMIWF